MRLGSIIPPVLQDSDYTATHIDDDDTRTVVVKNGWYLCQGIDITDDLEEKLPANAVVDMYDIYCDVYIPETYTVEYYPGSESSLGCIYKVSDNRPGKRYCNTCRHWYTSDKIHCVHCLSADTCECA